MYRFSFSKHDTQLLDIVSSLETEFLCLLNLSMRYTSLWFITVSGTGGITYAAEDIWGTHKDLHSWQVRSEDQGQTSKLATRYCALKQCIMREAHRLSAAMRLMRSHTLDLHKQSTRKNMHGFLWSSLTFYPSKAKQESLKAVFWAKQFLS